MGWFGRERSAAASSGDDAKALRDGLLVLLGYLQDKVPSGRSQRVSKLMTRLQRFPVPTGLVRELRGVRGELLLAEGSPAHDVDPRLLGRLADGLVALNQSTALIHSGLEHRLTSLRSGLPRRIDKDDVEAILSECDELSKSARGMRRRALEDREELSKLLQEMGRRLSRADVASGQMGSELDALARELVHHPAPEELRAARQTLVDRIERITHQAGTLAQELERARVRSRDLETVVQRQAEELVDVRARAALDPLTGVCNRGTFDQALRQTLQRARVAEAPLSVLLFDIDHFKSVNDTHGHAAGDAVLVAFAGAVRDLVRDDDVVARYGGEEFAVILPGAGQNVAMSVAERVRETTAALEFAEPAGSVRVTVSAGVALMLPADSPRSLVRRADAALYAAKHGGRNQVRLARVA